jgi:hypothetical protein
MLKNTKNKILVVAHYTIPYIKQLRIITGGVTSAILMQQLDYWFNKYPDGFYKFMSPCQGHPKYKKGQSWQEELCFTKDEFRTAFDRIAIRYLSKTEYDKAEDKFNEKFYCSYIDKIEGLTYYFRNHELVDKTLDNIKFEEIDDEL